MQYILQINGVNQIICNLVIICIVNMWNTYKFMNIEKTFLATKRFNYKLINNK